MINRHHDPKQITVFGAYGHTGKFVVAELVKRGLTPILSGRNSEKLQAAGSIFPGLELRPASIDEPRSLDDALEGSIAVINCAGPFLDTATAIAAAALRMGVHYLDIAAEQRSVLTLYERFDQDAVAKGILMIPALAFYGGLADLLATTAMGNWSGADAIDIGIALDSWMPTQGTRLTGRRNTAQRLTFANSTLTPVSDPLPTRKWQFAEPFGVQDMVGFSLTEVITLSRHLSVKEINTYINVKAMDDIHNSDTPPPVKVDDTGRSAQLFLMETVVRSGSGMRKARAAGRDIYYITAPLVAEAAVRMAEGMVERYGVASVAEVFDADDFLTSLFPELLVTRG